MNISKLDYDQKAGTLSVSLNFSDSGDISNVFNLNTEGRHNNVKVNSVATRVINTLMSKVTPDKSLKRNVSKGTKDLQKIDKVEARDKSQIIKSSNTTRCISRINNHDTHGYYVRVPLKKRKKGKLKHKSKLFSDSIFGGKSNALNAAIVWRDDHFYREQGRPVSDRFVREYYDGKYKEDVGISRHTRIRKGRPYHYWTASFCEKKGKQHHKEFSILEHGEDVAKELARDFRAKKVMNILGIG